MSNQPLTSPKQLSKTPENVFFYPGNGQNEPLRGPNFDLNIQFLRSYERERQGPDRRYPSLKNAELFNLFPVS